MAFNLENLRSVFKADLGKQGKDQIIGVDVGASAIKVVQLHLEGKVPTLDTYGELQLGPYANLEIGRITRLKEQRLTEALVDIIRESAVTANNVALSISYSSSFATTLTIQSANDDELAKRVPVEARKYVPVSLSEVTLDWFPLARDEEKGYTKLLLVAIYNSAFSELQNVVSGAGLTLSYNELEPFSAIRSSISRDDTSVALIDFGASSTKLYIAKDGILQKTHNLKPTGNELTNVYKKALGIEFGIAEEAKRRIGVIEGGESDEAVREVRGLLTRGLRELDKVIDGYEVENGIQAEKVFLLGGGSLLPGLLPLVEDILQRQAVVANPFSKIAYQAFLEDTLKEAGPSFSVAIGVALRSFSE